MKIFAKMLEAVGIASVMIALIDGLYGSMWNELYFLIAGIAVFSCGRIMEKRVQKKQDRKSAPEIQHQ